MRLAHTTTTLEKYTADIHRHRVAAWASARAANQSTSFRFDVLGGLELLSLGAQCHATFAENFLIEHANQVRRMESQSEFDRWHKNTIEKMLNKEKLQGVVNGINKRKPKNRKKIRQGSFTYGIAAKILNVYLKVFFLGEMGCPKTTFVHYLHPPIDSILLKELKNSSDAVLSGRIKNLRKKGQSVPAWTSLTEDNYNELIGAIKEFLGKKHQTELWKIEFAWCGFQ